MKSSTTSFAQVVRERRSVRGFVPDRSVPDEVLREALSLAQWAPSNCNVQPWRVYLASGERCAQLRQQLLDAVDIGDFGEPEDAIDTFAGDDRRLQVACAVELYGKMGVERDDMMGRMLALRRNFAFFDAPHVAMICMSKEFGVGVALDVGMYVQTLMLALQAQGVSTCAQAALRQHPAIIKPALGIPDDQRILCGLSIGYEAPNIPANNTRQTREDIDHNVTFLT